MLPGTVNRTALRRGEQALMIAALGAITLASWLGTAATASGMSHMATMTGMAPPSWPAHRVAAVGVMWVVMMVAMMAPSAAPMFLAYTGVVRREHDAALGVFRSSLFVSGYLLVWTAFALAATVVQWQLSEARLLSAGQVGPVLGGLVLIAAGVYQFTPWKQACLGKCRTPFGFLLNEWREGNGGAMRMGLRHGLSCTGCCWGLMAVLFAVGVMNLVWMAIVTVVVGAEKVLPGGNRIALAGGAAIVGLGCWILASPVIAAL